MIPAFKRQKPAALSVSEASLMDIKEFQASEGYTASPCLKKHKNKTNHRTIQTRHPVLRS